MKVLDDTRAEALGRLCELIVPGSARVEPVVYVDAVLDGMPPPVRDHALEAIDALAPASRSTETLAGHAHTPEFAFVRALAVEAFYSDFVAPGADGPGAWSEIDFSTPLAMRLHKDWSYMGIG